MDAQTLTEPNSIELNIELTDEQFFQVCQNNRDLQLERTATGELIIMPPTGGETSNHNARLTQRLMNWTDSNNLGIAFDSGKNFFILLGASVNKLIKAFSLPIKSRISIGSSKL
jgi:Uma2 family endonuclease